MRLIALFLLCTSCAYVSAADQDARLAEFDLDGDGFADMLAGGTDCDDDDDAIFPGAEEACDGIDNNCNDVVDDNLMVIRFADVDEDGFGDLTNPVLACPDDTGSADNSDDCDDEHDDVHPDADELCNGRDDDCDHHIDNDAGELVYRDQDGDGYGVPGSERRMCEPDPGWTTQNGDCDDSSELAYPGADELCDEVDNDCNGTIDDTGEGVGIDWYQDVDKDGWGNDEVVVVSCAPPEGFVHRGGDCMDEQGDIHPDAKEENCDDIDQDCDGLVNDSSRDPEC